MRVDPFRFMVRLIAVSGVVESFSSAQMILHFLHGSCILLFAQNMPSASGAVIFTFALDVVYVVELAGVGTWLRCPFLSDRHTV